MPSHKPLVEPRSRIASRTLGALAASLMTRLPGQQRRSARQGLDPVTQYDPLTGLPGRDALRGAIAGLGTAPARVMVVDVAGMRRFNACHGTTVGDRLLAVVARHLLAAVGNCDIVARWGGDEFVVVLPDASRGDARAAAARLHGILCRSGATDTPGDEAAKVTIGHAALAYRSHGALETAVREAQEEIHAIKQSGCPRAA